MIKCQCSRVRDETTGVKQVHVYALNRDEFWGEEGSNVFWMGAAEGLPSAPHSSQGFPFHHISFQVVKPYADSTERQSHWSTVVFTFLLFSLFCLGVGAHCHQNHGDKVVGVAGFYFTWRKAV